MQHFNDIKARLFKREDIIQFEKIAAVYIDKETVKSAMDEVKAFIDNGGSFWNADEIQERYNSVTLN